MVRVVIMSVFVILIIVGLLVKFFCVGLVLVFVFVVVCVGLDIILRFLKFSFLY